jgi:hypothetical protein
MLTDSEAPVTDLAPARPAGSKGFNMRLAMIVPGLGVLILGIFITVGFLTADPVQPVTTSKAPSSIGGTSLEGVPAVSALKVITASGEPPGNILNAVDLPVGAVRVSHQNNSAAADQYDAQIGLTSDASQASLLTFYKADMKKQGWQIFEKGPADHDPGAFEVLGKQAGSDGFYWEMGAVVGKTTFGPNAPPRGLTPFTIRLFQVPDPD